MGRTYRHVVASSFALLMSTLALASCSIDFPSGVFSCQDDAECPNQMFCWASDGLCYDSEEPPCEPTTCEEIIADFASIDIVVECGVFPSGCGEDFINCDSCPSGEACNPSSQCGCEENTCTTFGDGAQCGQIPTRCTSGGTIDCGGCPGVFECVDNRCVCPTGIDCDADCPAPCGMDEVCVEGVCCEPLFPCATNECSPPGGLDNGCGGFDVCSPCPNGKNCSFNTEDSRHECVDDCSCEAAGFECDPQVICGTDFFCGTCTDPAAPLCENGRCVCKDSLEPNEDTRTASNVCTGSPCNQQSWSVDVSGILDSASDRDFFIMDAGHTESTSIQISISGLSSTRTIALSYICPNGLEGTGDCSGSSSSIGGRTFCIEDAKDTLTMGRACQFVGEGGTARVYAAVWSKEGEFQGPCDDYDVTVSTTPSN